MRELTEKFKENPQVRESIVIVNKYCVLTCNRHRMTINEHFLSSPGPKPNVIVPYQAENEFPNEIQFSKPDLEESKLYTGMNEVDSTDKQKQLLIEVFNMNILD